MKWRALGDDFRTLAIGFRQKYRSRTELATERPLVLADVRSIRRKHGRGRRPSIRRNWLDNAVRVQ